MDITGIIGVLTGFGLVVLVPIIHIMTSHQRKMAELTRPNLPTAELLQMKQEIEALKEVVTQQTIVNDDLRRQLMQSNRDQSISS